MLADVLRCRGEPVLAVDLNPADLLRLHFGIPYADTKGWAAAQGHPVGWVEQTHVVDRMLQVLPYGRHGSGLAGNTVVNPDAIWRSLIQDPEGRHYNTRPSWVVFDAPATPAELTELHKASDLHLLVCPPDMAAHILLGQYPLEPNTRLLINGVDPGRAANASIVLDWNLRHANRLAPVHLHHDGHMDEALGHKMTAVMRFPASTVARSMHRLAVWCLEQRAGP